MQSDSRKATQQASSRAKCWGGLIAHKPTSHKIPRYPGQVIALSCFNQSLLRAVKFTSIQGEHAENNQSIKTVGNAAINPGIQKSSPAKVLRRGRAEYGAGSREEYRSMYKAMYLPAPSRRALCLSELRGFLSCLSR